MFRPPKTLNTLSQQRSLAFCFHHCEPSIVTMHRIATRTASKTAHKIIFVDDFGFPAEPTESAAEFFTSIYPHRQGASNSQFLPPQGNKARQHPHRYASPWRLNSISVIKQTHNIYVCHIPNTIFHTDSVKFSSPWATIPHKEIPSQEKNSVNLNPYRFAFSSDLPLSAASLGSLPLNCFFYFAPTFPFRLRWKLRNS